MRRERIVEAAREIIATQGLDALSTRKLAKAANLNIHTLYALIGNKLAIIEAVTTTMSSGNSWHKPAQMTPLDNCSPL